MRVEDFFPSLAHILQTSLTAGGLDTDTVADSVFLFAVDTVLIYKVYFITYLAKASLSARARDFR